MLLDSQQTKETTKTERRKNNLLKPMVIKKMSVLLVVIMIVSMLVPVLAFAANYVDNVSYDKNNGTVSATVYSDVYDSVYGNVNLKVYSDAGLSNALATVYKGTYDGVVTVGNTTYYYFTFNDVSVGSSVYNALYLQSSYNSETSTVYNAVYTGTETAPTLSNIFFGSNAYSVNVGSTVSTAVYAAYSNGLTANVTNYAAFTSSTKSVATVNAATGVVTGVSAGSTVINATYGDQTATVTVSVYGNTGSTGGSGGSGSSGGTGSTGGTETSQLDGTTGTITESALKDSFAKSEKVEIKIKETIALPASALLEAAKKSGATLTIVGENGTYVLPLSVLKLDELAKALGVDLKDLKINISIKKVTGNDAKAVTDAIAGAGVTALTDAVDFAITAEGKDGKKISIDSFGNTYVKRKLPIKKAASKTATVALYNPATKSLSFVPSKISATEAEFQRTGNSVYVVVENSASFNDVAAGYWAKADIELLASKLVVEGTGAGKFEAERNITRAEFAALVVKALGLTVPSVTTNTYFSDVKSGEWYTGYVAAAKAAGLVDGYEDGTFKADKQITREELAALVVRALKFAGVKTDIAADKQAKVLAKFADSNNIVWAQKEIAAAIDLGIVNGVTDTTLDSKANANRAQSATMLKRLLSKAGFIN